MVHRGGGSGSAQGGPQADAPAKTDEQIAAELKAQMDQEDAEREGADDATKA